MREIYTIAFLFNIIYAKSEVKFTSLLLFSDKSSLYVKRIHIAVAVVQGLRLAFALEVERGRFE